MQKAHRRIFQNQGSERGQSIVEFAIVAPLLVALVLGLMEIGNGLNSYITVVAAARDGARMGSDGKSTEAQIRNLIGKETQDTLSSTLPTGSEVCGAEGVCVDQTFVGSDKAIKVTVCYDHPLMVGYPPFLSGPIRMCSSTTMRINDAS